MADPERQVATPDTTAVTGEDVVPLSKRNLRLLVPLVLLGVAAIVLFAAWWPFVMGMPRWRVHAPGFPEDKRMYGTLWTLPDDGVRDGFLWPNGWIPLQFHRYEIPIEPAAKAIWHDRASAMAVGLYGQYSENYLVDVSWQALGTSPVVPMWTDYIAYVEVCPPRSNTPMTFVPDDLAEAIALKIGNEWRLGDPHAPPAIVQSAILSNLSPTYRLTGKVIWWPGVVHTSIVVGLPLVGLVLTNAVYRWYRRQHRGRELRNLLWRLIRGRPADACPQCRYPLAGLVVENGIALCPECGRATRMGIE